MAHGTRAVRGVRDDISSACKRLVARGGVWAHVPAISNLQMACGSTCKAREC